MIFGGGSMDVIRQSIAQQSDSHRLPGIGCNPGFFTKEMIVKMLNAFKLRRFFSVGGHVVHEPLSAEKGFHRIETTDELFSEQADLIKRIDARIGLSSTTFRDFHREVIVNFARLVQRLPAPDSNQLLIRETLQRCLERLSIKQPFNRSSDPIWQFAILIAVLCDDASQRFKTVGIYYDDGDANRTLWHPVDGFLDTLCHQYCYELHAINQKQGSNFDRILFFNLLLTKNSHSWLAQDPSVTKELNHFLSGIERDNAFDDLITSFDVDKESVDQHNTSALKLPNHQRDNPTEIIQVQIPHTVPELTNTTLVQPNSQQQTQHHTSINRSVHNQLIRDYKDWLNDALATGTTTINQTNARLHIVDAGLLMISPNVFKDYEKACQVSWLKLQKAVLKAQWHIRDSANQNFLTYSIHGQLKTSTIRGIVIRDPSHLLTGRIPQPNPHLSPI
jgi:hypothetical protein